MTLLAPTHPCEPPFTQLPGYRIQGSLEPGTDPALGQDMNQCHLCGRCQDPRCQLNGTHAPDCTGLNYGMIWEGTVLCLMYTEIVVVEEDELQ